MWLLNTNHVDVGGAMGREAYLCMKQDEDDPFTQPKRLTLSHRASLAGFMA